MKVRVELSKIKTFPITSDTPDIPDIPDNPDNPDNPGNPAIADTEIAALVSGVRFAVTPEIPEGYTSRRFNFPFACLSFNFPASDHNRVSAWFTGDYSEVTALPSDTLIRNMSKSILTLLDDYYGAVKAQSLFAMPFKAGMALRLADGRRIACGTPEAISPDSTSPRILINSRNVADNGLSCDVEIESHPGRLNVSCNAIDMEKAAAAGVEAIEIYVTGGTPLYTKNLEADEVINFLENGNRLYTFRYSSTDAAVVAASLAADTDYRIVAEIPLADAAGGLSSAIPEIAVGSMSVWSSLPKLTDKAGGTESGGDTPGPDDPPFEPYSHFLTEPLALGMEESEKWIRGVTLRGIFPHDAARLTLEGSHHREHWRRIAASQGAILRRIHGVRYRWYRVEVEVELREGDTLEALTFEIEVCK